MARLVCHVTTLKRMDIPAAQSYYNRLREMSSGSNVDRARIRLTYDALTGESNNPQINYYDMTARRIQEGYQGKRALRINAVWLVSIFISAKREFFKQLTEEERKNFFKTAADYFAARFGRENVIAAKVYVDKRSPHMHFSFVPIKEGRLIASAIIDRTALREIHTELPEVLHQAGFDIEKAV